MNCEILTFLRQNGGRIKLSLSVVEKIQEYLQIGPNTPEGGGVLLGRYILGCEDVVADEASAPMRNDKRGRYHFYRDHKRHQYLINEAWAESNGTCTYLGEWHTHPEDDPKPSGPDWNDWRRKMQQDRFDGNHLFFIIAGTRRIKIWEGDKRHSSFRELPTVKKESR